MRTRPRQILIQPKTNGCLVHIDCQDFVFEDTDNMIAELRRYLHNPEEVEKEYAEKYGFDFGHPTATELLLERPGPSGSSRYITADDHPKRC